RRGARGDDPADRARTHGLGPTPRAAREHRCAPGRAHPAVQDGGSDCGVAVSTVIEGDIRRLVLVVDDDEVVREVVRMVLEADDFEVVEAADGAEALASVAADHPPLMVLDVMMPG